MLASRLGIGRIDLAATYFFDDLADFNGVCDEEATLSSVIVCVSLYASA
jgi:hypothetical protein